MTGAGERACRMWVSGRVQGVGFRWFARRAALGLGLTGRVRNLPDGRVEVEVAGAPDRLDEIELSGVPAWDGFEIDR